MCLHEVEADIEDAGQHMEMLVAVEMRGMDAQILEPGNLCLTLGTQLVFVTCGADGCEFASLRAQGHVDGLKGLTVTDTTGAGDIFGGCAVWRLLQSGKAPAALDEAELRGIAEFACRVAGRSTEKSGGISAITEMPDEAFMG